MSSVTSFTNRLVKIHVQIGDSVSWTEQNCQPGEPVFVPRHSAKGEDDGVVLSVVLDPNSGKSFLLVLDSKSFKEIARASVPHHIPFGIHGQYYGDTCGIKGSTLDYTRDVMSGYILVPLVHWFTIFLISLLFSHRLISLFKFRVFVVS